MANVKQTAKRILASPATVLFFILAMALAAVNAHHLEMGFLSLHSLDEYAFHGSLLTMYDGLREHNLQKIFGFSFYNYGFGFFVLNLLATLPFLDGNHTAAAIYMPRMVSSLTALAGIYYLYRSARLQAGVRTAILLVALAVSMPAFWVNANLFHPDWLMTTCLLAAFYHFSCNDNHPGPHYWYGILWFGLAAGLGKFQAFTFLPFLFFYTFHDELARRDFSPFAFHLKRALLSIAAVIIIFIILNPYLLHPLGLQAFLSLLDENLMSNATGNGLTVKFTPAEKIRHAIFDYYVNPLLLAAFLTLAVFWCIDYFRLGKRRSFQALAFYFLACLAYLLFAVNKDWQAYYLGLFMPAVLLAAPLCTALRPAWQIAILLLALLSQVAYYGNGYAQIATLSFLSNPDTTERLRHQREVSDFILQNLRDKATPGSTVLISDYTGFSYDRIGMDYRNVFVIYGALSADRINPDALAAKYPDPEIRKIKLARFKPKDFIILRRDDVYFKPEKLNRMYDTAGYSAAIRIIQQLDSGNLGYRKIAENNDVLIYRRASSTPATTLLIPK